VIAVARIQQALDLDDVALACVTLALPMSATGNGLKRKFFPSCRNARARRKNAAQIIRTRSRSLTLAPGKTRTSARWSKTFLHSTQARQAPCCRSWPLLKPMPRSSTKGFWNAAANFRPRLQKVLPVASPSARSRNRLTRSSMLSQPPTHRWGSSAHRLPAVSSTSTSSPEDRQA
jgi:hypothetical protein